MEDLLKHALEEYKADFGEDFDPTWKPTTEHELADKLTSEKINFDSWRRKHARLWKALSAVALPITNLGRVAGEITTGAFPPAAAATAGLLSLVAACEKVTEAYNSVEDLFVKLEDVLGRWNIVFRNEVDDHLRKKMQEILALLLSIVTQSRKLMKHGRARRYLKSFAFGKDPKIADLMDRLENLLQSEDRLRSALSLDKVSALYNNHVQAEDARLIEKLNSVAVGANNQAFRFNLENRLAGTADWFKDEPTYQSWVQNTTPLFLLLGGPGSGKSYLATSLVEDLTRKNRQQHFSIGDEAISLAYFFVEQGQDIMTILKTMAYQLQANNQRYRQHVTQVLEQSELYTMRETWKKLYLDYWDQSSSTNGRVILVIDGLSKADSDDVEVFVSDMIRYVMGRTNNVIQFAIFGRMELWSYFKFVPQEQYVEIDSTKNQEDMSRFVDQQLLQVIVLRRRAKAEKLDFKRQILELCAGNFEWARLLLAQCRDKEKHQIRELLQDPPKSLDETIKSCFDQIMAEDILDPPMLRTLLTCLTYSRRPMRFGEIYNAIRIVTGKEYRLLWKNIVRYLSSVIRWRSSQTQRMKEQSIGVDSNDDSDGGDDDDDDHIEVLDEEAGWPTHVSQMWLFFGNSKIRDYVIEQSNEGVTSNETRWPLSEQGSECSMVKICLKTLQKEGILEDDNIHLLHYALRFMPLHLQQLDQEALQQEDKSEIVAGLIELFNTEHGHEILARDGGDIAGNGLFAFRWSWVETKTYTRVVQSWFHWACETNLVEGEAVKSWLSAASMSSKEFFKPFAEYLRLRWLSADWKPGPIRSRRRWNSEAMLATLFLPAFDNMDEEGNIPEESKNTFMKDSIVTVDDIVASAKASPLMEKDSGLLGLAATFDLWAKSEPMLKYAQMVSNTYEGYWAAAGFQARAHGSQYNIEQALHWSKISCQLNPEGSAELELLVVEWLLNNNDAAGALEKARQKYNQDPTAADFGFASIYLDCLCLREDRQTILEVIKYLHSQPATDKPYSILISILLNNNSLHAWPALGQVYIFSSSQAERAFILDVVDSGLASIAQAHDEWDQISWLNQVARFYWRFVANGQKLSIDKFLKNLSRIEENNYLPDETIRNELLIKTRASCALWTYRSAVEQEATADPDLEKTLDTLQTMTAESPLVDGMMFSMANWFDAFIPCLIYGRWLRQHQEPGDERWREYFREPLLQYLNMLDDSNQRNDLVGLLDCAQIFEIMGDFETACAIEAVLQVRMDTFINELAAKNRSLDNLETKQLLVATQTSAPFGVQSTINSEETLQTGMSFKHSSPGESSAEETGDDVGEDQLEILLDTDMVLVCECCKVLCHIAGSLYNCEQCIDTSYCKACIPTGPLHPVYGRACGNHHNIVQFYPFSEKQRNEACLKKGNRVYMRKSWLRKIREEWKEPEKKSTDT